MPTPSARSSGRSSSNSYSLQFPADLSVEQVIAWLSAVSGSRSRGFVSEVWGTDRGLRFRLRVPTPSSFVVGQLRALIPGIRVESSPAGQPRQWSRVIEVGTEQATRTLRIDDPDCLAASLLAVLSGVHSRETVVFQWVVLPAVRERPPRQARSRQPFPIGRDFVLAPSRIEPDEIADRRAKLSEENWLGVLRVAVQTHSSERADEIVSQVRMALGSVRTPENGTYMRHRWQRRLVEQFNNGSTPLLFPGQYARSELAALLAWPMGTPHIAGLPQARSRHLPPSGVIAGRGRVLARSNFPGAERPLALSPENSCQHLHIVGPTNAGKTTVLANLAAQDMMRGAGLLILEAKGDLFRRVLDLVPASRLNDVIVMEMGDGFPVGYNVLADGAPRVVVDSLCQLFEGLYRDTHNVWTREVLYHGLSTLVARPGHAFIDLLSLLAPMNPDEEAWRDELISSLDDRELRAFWRRFLAQSHAEQMRMVQPVLDRVWQLNSRVEIRSVIGQATSSFSMTEVLQQRKILIVNLAGVGGTTASLLGSILMSALWRAAQTGASTQPFMVLLDEFQDFINFSSDPADLFTKARSFRLAITAAHQHLDQLDAAMQAAILANGRSKVVFQTTHQDARTFAREFGGQVDEADLMNLGKYEIITRLVTDGGVSQPATGVTLPPALSAGLAGDVRQRSRARYGRPLADVLGEIERRRMPRSTSPRRRPRLGGQSWE